jgi:hypothetical protein
MNHGAIHNSDFWQSQFQITNEAVEALLNSILEAGEPQSIDEVSLFFVNFAIEEQQRRLRSEIEQGKPYLPDQAYEVGDQLVFTHLNYAVGKVVDIRAGFNPADGEFTVLDVLFEEENDLTAQFAAGLSTPHALLRAEQTKTTQNGTGASAQKIYSQFETLIRPKVERALRQHSEFVNFSQDWFLTGMLVEVEEGLLNIVDAAIDIGGGPLNVDALIEQIDLHGSGKITEAMRFSVNYRLDNDERFENVGTEARVLWYLDRLQPAEVRQIPLHLRADDLSFNVSFFDAEQRALLREIDDELTPYEFQEEADPKASSVTFILNYPHRREGTLPVLPTILSILPEPDNPLLALQFIDGRTGDSWYGWWVTDHNYIYGLEDWYRTHQIPVGAFVNLTKTDDPHKLVVDLVPHPTQQEHVRVASVRNDRLVFEMKRRRLVCRYDELMIIGEEGSVSIEVLWERVRREKLALYDLLVQILPELVKLTSQGAVHFKTIYSAINILKRTSPGPLMQELIMQDSFVSMGHGYWTYRAG